MLSMRVFLAAAALCAGLPAQAQTAGDINRLNSAIQICNSPMGAGMAECAKLRGQLGGGGVGGSLSGGTVGTAAGLLGSVMSATRPSAPVAPAVNSAAIQQGIAACVQNAAGNATMIQACLTAASARPAPVAPAYGIQNYQAAAPAARGPSSMLPSDQRSQDAAMAIHRSGQNYQACAAANPSNWQSCLPLLNGGAAPR